MASLTSSQTKVVYPEEPPHAQYPNSSIRESQKRHRSCSVLFAVSSPFFLATVPPYTTSSAFFPQIFCVYLCHQEFLRYPCQQHKVSIIQYLYNNNPSLALSSSNQIFTI